MSKKIIGLTDTKIRNAKSTDKLYKLRDGDGLILCVNPSGSKSWRIEYRRPTDDKRDSITIGKYPMISLADARQKKEKILSLIAHGEDPKIKLQEKNQVITLNCLFPEWYSRWSLDVTPKYALQVKRALEANIFNLLGKKDISIILPKDIVNALSSMENRGVLEYLKRTKGALKQMFDFAVERGLCSYNPVTSIGGKAFKKPEKRHFAALKPEQLGELLNAIKNSSMANATKNCILLQLSTLCRPAEASNMIWNEIDFENKLWTIPAERMKAKREHVVPLSEFSQKIIQEMKLFSDNNKYVFTGNIPNKPLNRETPRVALREFKEIGLDTTSHGLRALARTYLEKSGQWRKEVMEAALAHKESDNTVAAYNRHDYLSERQEMLEWWGNEIKKHLK